MTPAKPLRGLYAITSASLCTTPSLLNESVAAALRGGATLIQYRDKQGDTMLRRANAEALLTLCRTHGARLIINDDADLANAIGADGVHLGASDGSLEAARALLGREAILGASCGTGIDRARQALAAGASYVAFGRFFDSRTKPNAPQATLELLEGARRSLPESTTICAIGGVTPDNGGLLVARGADLIAAVEGVFGPGNAKGIEAAARAYASLFEL